MKQNFINIDSISDVNAIFNADSPDHPLVSVIRINNPNIRKKFDNEHFIINLYSIAIKDISIKDLSYGRNKFDFQSGTMMFIKPGQVISPGDEEKGENDEGWMLFFHPDLIRQSQLSSKIKSYDFFSYNLYEALHLSKKERNELKILVDKIEAEYSQNIDRHSQNVIVSTIELILNYATRYYDRQFFTRSVFNKDKVSEFEELLTSYCDSDQLKESGIPSVQYFAEILNMSPQYLTEMLKKETGRSAQSHIHEVLISKAKTTLLNSNKSVSEIAYDLGFEYPQYFSTLFKKKTQLNPSDFRSLN